LKSFILKILNRKTPKGRDYYDAMYLFSIATPDYNYLSFKAGVNNIQELKARLELKIQSINFKELIKDVSPFLINSDDIKRVELFPEFLKGLK
jgi:hypothetical protein